VRKHRTVAPGGSLFGHAGCQPASEEKEQLYIGKHLIKTLDKRAERGGGK